jgi:hypothetical protein
MKTRIYFSGKQPVRNTFKAGQLVILKDKYYSERHSEGKPHICLVLEDENKDGNFLGIRLAYTNNCLENAYSKNWHADCWELFHGELILSNEEEK